MMVPLLLSASVAYLHSPTNALQMGACRRTPAFRVPVTSQPRSMPVKLEFETPTGKGLTNIAVGAGLVANPIMWWSLFVLKTTGCGLPAGPFGLLGAAEGVSYLVVTGVVIASVVTKFRSGSGLPSGPFGLLGAVEGLSFLTALAGLAVLGLQITDYGYIPNAVPGEGSVCS